MEYKFVAHKQLVLRSNAIPIGIALIELSAIIIFAIGFGYDESYLFGSIAVAMQTSLIWLILFIVFHNLYKEITFDELGVSTKKVQIPWESIKDYKIREVKVRGRKNLFVSEWKYLDSMLCLYGEDGKKIKFACKKEHISKMKELASGKNKAVDEIISRIV